VAVVAACSAVALAQQSAAPATPAPPPATAPPATQPAGAKPPAASDEEFIPSQELSADEAVTFPVDI
jgi:hypothetical protein